MNKEKIEVIKRRQKEIIVELHQLPENQLVLEAERGLERARQALTLRQKPLLREITTLSRKIEELRNDHKGN